MSTLSFSILRLRNFRLYLLMRVCLSTALLTQFVTLGWQIYSLTKSPFMLGLAGLTEAAPALICSLFAGHVVDAHSPLKVTRLTQLGFTLNMAAFLVLGGGFTHLQGESLVHAMFACVFVSGLIRSFAGSVFNALMSTVVPKNDLPSAAGWQSAGWHSANICGPALAGLVYGGYGPRCAWLLPAMFAATAFAIALSIRPMPGAAAETKPGSVGRDFRSGWRFILSHQVILSALILDCLSTLLGGATAMLPVYADQILHVGAEGLGALRAAPALGGITTALTMSLLPRRRLSAARMLLGSAGFGAAIICFGLSRSFPLSMALLVLAGIGDTMSAVTRNSILHIATPPEMRGRVWAINSMFFISSSEIGAFESGAAARFLGLVPSVVAGGIGTLLVVAMIATASPKFRKTVVDV